VKAYSSYHNKKKVEMVVGIFLSTATAATLQRTTHQVTIVEVTIDWAISPCQERSFPSLLDICSTDRTGL
jgi:hypothetical protein